MSIHFFWLICLKKLHFAFSVFVMAIVRKETIGTLEVDETIAFCCPEMVFPAGIKPWAGHRVPVCTSCQFVPGVFIEIKGSWTSTDRDNLNSK